MSARRPRPHSPGRDEHGTEGVQSKRPRRDSSAATAAAVEGATACERAVAAAAAATRSLARATREPAEHVAADDAQRLFDEFQQEQEQQEEQQEERGRHGSKKPVPRDFTPSGRLKEDTALRYKGRVLRFDEPPDAAVPDVAKDGCWRIYTFKGRDRLGEPLVLRGGSCFLAGRDRAVVDIPLDHPTCSAQHCVFQYRRVPRSKDRKDSGECVKLFVMDLSSTNGTFLNGDRLRQRVYVELMEKDVLKFAHSTRDYVMVKEPPTEQPDTRSDDEA